MLQFDKRLYDSVCELKRGTANLSPFLEAVRAKLAQRFNIPLLAVILDAIDVGPAKGKPRLNVITEFEKDCKPLQTEWSTVSNESRQIILNTFTYESKHADPPQRPIDPEKILVLTESFSAMVIEHVVSNLRKYEPMLLQKFAADNVWRIVSDFAQATIFFTDENAKRTASQNTTCDRLRQSCFDQIKPYDEFNYITLESLKIKFDTKENLVKNFAGNLFFYFR